MGRLAGKVAIVTGAASGIGKATAQLFVKEGAKVVFTDIQADKGKALEKELGENALFIEQDVTKSSDWEKVINAVTEKFGTVHILVNNAGVGGGSYQIEDVTEEEFDRFYNLNQKSVFLGMKYCIPLMKKNGTGSIINVSSIMGLIGGPGQLGYVATKHAVTGMTKVAAAELAAHKIRVNSVHPGAIKTELVEAIYQDPVFRKGIDALIEKNPSKRMGDPSEVANLMLFLASDESSLCTGAQFVIDGGQLAIV